MSSRILKDSLPAERKRGMIFTEQFRNEAEVQENEGVITDVEFENGEASFNGSSSNVNYGNINNVGSNDFTILVRFKTIASDPTGGATNHFLLSKGSGAPIRYGVAIQTGSGVDGKIVCDVDDNSVAKSVTSAIGFNDGSWHFVAMTKDTNLLKLYIDGVFITSTSVLGYGSLTNSNDFILGKVSSGVHSFFTGDISLSKFFNKALSAEEILAYSDGSMFSYNKDCVLALPMLTRDHDASNGITKDRSGNGNDATFGDGSTASTFPTKLDRRGYDFPLSTSYSRTQNDLCESTTSATVTILISNMNSGVNRMWHLHDTPNNNFGGVGLYSNSGNLFLVHNNGSSARDLSYSINLNTYNIITLVFKDDKSMLTFVNNEPAIIDISINYLDFGGYVGVGGVGIPGLTDNIEANIYNIRIHNTALNATQVLDIHNEMMNGLREEG